MNELGYDEKEDFFCFNIFTQLLSPF